MTYKESYGKYFEDFTEGSLIYHWPGKTITESDNNLFCLLTMNNHPVHSDVNYSKEQEYKKIMVVGTLVFSLSVGMTVSDISGKAIANLEYKNIKHTAPVFIGDTLYVSTRTVNMRESKTKSDRGIVTVESFVRNQDDILVLKFERAILVPKKS